MAKEIWPTPNKDGNKLEQAHYWLSRAIVFEGQAANEADATLKMQADNKCKLAFDRALKLEAEHFAASA